MPLALVVHVFVWIVSMLPNMSRTLIYMEFAVVGADVDFSSSTSSMYHSIIMWSLWSSQWDFCCASSWSRCHSVFVTEVHVFLIVIIFMFCCCYCRCCCRCHWWRQWWWCYVVVVAVVHIYYPVMLGDRFGARDDVFPTKWGAKEPNITG